MMEFLNNYAFAITVIFIVLTTLVAAFLRRIKKDKCLKDFRGCMVTIEDTAGKMMWGKFNVENTGLELIYSQPHKDADGHLETIYILYKHEYAKLQVLVRYHDQLSEAKKKQREISLEKTYHPGFWSRLRRKTANVFKTTRDSVMEVVNMMLSQAKQKSPASGLLKSQDKYVSQIKQELMGSVGTSYEPLLEKYIGNKVVIEMIRGDNLFEYSGVLKDYSADFVEIMDVTYSPPLEEKNDSPDLVSGKIADLVIPRNYGLVRHKGE